MVFYNFIYNNFLFEKDNKFKAKNAMKIFFNKYLSNYKYIKIKSREVSSISLSKEEVIELAPSDSIKFYLFKDYKRKKLINKIFKINLKLLLFSKFFI